MALFERPSLGSLVTGFALGVGASYLIPDLLPAVGRVTRPAARALLRSGVQLYERSREAAAELGEMAGDMVAEAQAELEQQHNGAARASASAGSGQGTGNGHSPQS
jgi:hypothetical protein